MRSKSVKKDSPLTSDRFFGMIRCLAALWPKHAMPVVLAAVAAGLLAASAAHAAPTSTLHLVDSNDQPSVLYTVQGGTGTITSTPLTPNGFDSAIAVTSTIKTLGYNWISSVGSTGYQYTLSGVPTGTTYTNPVPSAWFSDGASDGTNNYSVDYYSGTVYRFNSNWANPTPLFTDSTPFGNVGITGISGDVGIAYDRTNNTIWLDNSYSETLLRFRWMAPCSPVSTSTSTTVTRASRSIRLTVPFGCGMATSAWSNTVRQASC